MSWMWSDSEGFLYLCNSHFELIFPVTGWMKWKKGWFDSCSIFFITSFFDYNVEYEPLPGLLIQQLKWFILPMAEKYILKEPNIQPLAIQAKKKTNSDKTFSIKHPTRNRVSSNQIFISRTLKWKNIGRISHHLEN